MNRLKLLREEKKLTQSDISKILNITTAAYSYYENEKRDMTPDTILKLSEYFKVSTDYLLGKSDIRNPGQQIDDILNEAMIGMSKEEYGKLTDVQKKQIKDFALFVKNQSQENEDGK